MNPTETDHQPPDELPDLSSSDNPFDRAIAALALNPCRELPPDPRESLVEGDDGPELQLQHEQLTFRIWNQSREDLVCLSFHHSILDLYQAVLPASYGRRLKANVPRNITIQTMLRGTCEVIGFIVSIESTSQRALLILDRLAKFGFRLGKVPTPFTMPDSARRVLVAIAQEILLTPVDHAPGMPEASAGTNHPNSEANQRNLNSANSPEDDS